MGTITIRLVQASTGPEVHVDLKSPPDDLPHEHEANHRQAIKDVTGLSVEELEAMGVVIRTNRAPAAPSPAPTAADPVRGRERLRGNAAPDATQSPLRRFLRGR